MSFDLNEALSVLEKTPGVLRELLSGLSNEWTHSNEGKDTWTAFDVVGHLIHGEKTDWVSRTEIILSNRADKSFTPFDRFAQFEESKGKSLDQLLEDFDQLRRENLEKIRQFNITVEDLAKTGIHPEFGTVSLKELLATWVAHDLNHIAHISRVMAKNYKSETGPWIKYLRILNIS